MQKAHCHGQPEKMAKIEISAQRAAGFNACQAMTGHR
jgi:hypothetical protein